MGNETDDTLMDLYVKAAGWVALMPPFANEEETGKAIDIVALAISKAIEETYEECAQIVDPIQTDDRMTDHEKHAFDLRDVLSQAIRSRSKGEE